MKIYKRLGIAIGFCLISISAISALKRPGKVIIDTDAGGDDAGAILLALATEKRMKNDGFEVIAITCVYGNANSTTVALNVRKILTIADRGDIPVYVGAYKPLVNNYTKGTAYGEDGLGDFEFEEEIVGEVDGSKHASVALTDLAREHRGNVSVVALGPLTNVALAITLDPSFVHNVKQFYVMGSSVPGVKSSDVVAEFNFYQDPHSNFVVLNGTRGLPVILFPWETVLSAAIPKKWRTEVLGAMDSRAIKFLNEVESRSLDGATWSAADVMVAALVLWPELITRALLTNVSPVYDGTAQGSVLVDYWNETGKTQNAIILEAFDVGGFEQVLLEAFS